MSLFNFGQEELLSFFAVLVRYSVLIAVLPFVGDRFIPVPVKILLSLALTICVFPSLVASGQVHPHDADVWGATTGGIVGTIGLEALFALVLGFTARMIFEAVTFGGNLAGTFMGFATASVFDPHQESQSQVIAEIQSAVAMLIFLALDGHHVMLRAAVDSFRTVGVGGLALMKQGGMNAGFAQKLAELSGDILKYGLALAAPVAIALFAVNVAFGVMAKAMPQINILVLSFAVSALVGLCVLFLSVPEFAGATGSLLSRMGEWMDGIQAAMIHG